MISAVDIHAFFDHVDDGRPITSSDRGKETLRWSNVNLAAPFSDINGVEAACNDLATWILLQKARAGVSRHKPDYEKNTNVIRPRI